MGKMEKNLISKLEKVSKNISSGTLPYPTLDVIQNSTFYEEVKNVYKNLGGILSEIPINLRKWDIEIDGIAFELDEQLHFNRYRNITLQSNIYEQLPKFPLSSYVTYCKYYEEACISAGSYGGKWSNDSCEKQFGKASSLKNFNGVGAPRWKQRAFYDFVKDLTNLLFNIPLVRISIHDVIIINNNKIPVKEVVENSGSYGSLELYELIKERTQLFD